MREHMAIEERDLFPRARAVLEDSDLEAIDRAFARVTDPFFEAELRDAYAAYSPLLRYLVEQPAVRRALEVLEAFYSSAGGRRGTGFACPEERLAQRSRGRVERLENLECPPDGGLLDELSLIHI